ncbi:MAG: MopE-related protein [Candidatus Nanoarchaeia archaeon]|nr:MopE-related protein [Candidatus Nanoarchaeia archaeon]
MMKISKNLLLCLVIVCLAIFLLAAVSYAKNVDAITIENITLNSVSSVNVSAGKKATASVTASVESGSWQKTQYKIGAGNYVCKDTPDYNAGANTVYFNITSPSNKGDYDFQVWACGSSCKTSKPCSNYTFMLLNPDGIHVVSKCGDLIVEASEICDGNSQNCTTSKGYAGTQSCKSGCLAWKSCVSSEKCGDGIINGPEQCDDGNKKSGDGCSSACLLETAYYRDKDKDGYGNTAQLKFAVSPPAGYVSENEDCNDNKADINPGMAEACNNIDDNCNDVIDEDLARPDDNVFGLCSANKEVCNAGIWLDSAENYIPINETCDEFDNDCDGEINEDNVCPLSSYYCDTDTDGYAGLIPIGQCDTYNCVPDGCSTEAGFDCDDANEEIYPGADESCNNIDDNCNGIIDENLSRADDNMFGLCFLNMEVCSAGEWFDNELNYLPSDEICDGFDNNCDGNVDEAENIEPQGIQAFIGFSPLVQSCYTGPEGTEGIGICASGLQTCAEGNWESCANEVLPAEEICDGFDNDCDGEIDNGNFTDSDADGIKDCVDIDNDNDGVDDDEDVIKGNSSDINTNVPGGLVFSVDDVQDAANYAGTGIVKIADSAGNALVEFEYDFLTALDLSSINLTLSNESGFGSLIIRGINLGGQNATKTAYVDRIAGTNTICIIDDEVDAIVVEGDCSNGIKVSCPGTSGDYSCELADGGARYKINGLRHSAVTEYSYVPPAPAEVPLIGGSSGILIVVPHNVPVVEEEPVVEEPIIEEEPAVEEKQIIKEEPVAEKPATTVEKARARLGQITGQVTNSLRSSPDKWGGAAGILLAVVLVFTIYINTRKTVRQ